MPAKKKTLPHTSRTPAPGPGPVVTWALPGVALALATAWLCTGSAFNGATPPADTTSMDPAATIQHKLTALLQQTAKQPDHADTQYELANTFKELGDTDAAIQHYMHSIHLGGSPEHVYMSGYNTGQLLERAHTAGQALTTNTTAALHAWLNRTITQPSLDDVRAAFMATAASLPYRIEADVNVARLHRAESNHGACFEHALAASLKGPHTEATLSSQKALVEYGVHNELCICGYYAKDAANLARGKQACETLVAKLRKEGGQDALLNQTLRNVEWYAKLA